jgi:hypothetical protein
MVLPSVALKALKSALDNTPRDVAGNFSSKDFMAALDKAIDDCETTEYDDYMGEDM